jgi:hypothetical protein
VGPSSRHHLTLDLTMIRRSGVVLLYLFSGGECRLMGYQRVVFTIELPHTA